MPTFTIPIYEANDCHLPAGSPQGGQFCSRTGSKVVDEGGELLTVYHGTSPYFSGDFDFTKLGSNMAAGNTVMGAFFTDSYMLARGLYAGRRGKVVEATLVIRKPFRLRDRGNYDNDIGYELRREARDYLERDPETAEDWLEFKGYLQRRGYDGLHYTSGEGRTRQDVWVAFDPSQITIIGVEDGKR